MESNLTMRVWVGSRVSRLCQDGICWEPLQSCADTSKRWVGKVEVVDHGKPSVELRNNNLFKAQTPVAERLLSSYCTRTILRVSQAKESRTVDIAICDHHLITKERI